MRAMVLRRLGPLAELPDPLEPLEPPQPLPGPQELQVRVSVCGVCHTELDEIEGRTPPPRLPVIPGHQVVGRVERLGEGVTGFARGDRVGIAWIHSACGHCRFCRSGRENLCPAFVATGRDVNGGYAEYATVPAAFAHPLPATLDDAGVAPLLCAGAIGYRSLRLSGHGDGDALGLSGFGASGHLVLQMVRRRFPRSRVHVFARSERQRSFALELGAAWAGAIGDPAPEPLQAVIDTTPAWRPDVAALGNLAPGGRLVINAIRKEEADKAALLALDYPRDLWMEKEIRSVANVTRRDVREFLALAADLGLRAELREFPLAEANRALRELQGGHGRGACVLRIGADG
ncbi:MAG: zinc-binding alcohol dehydrogenase family protein [Synechococcaceae cyanobacterium]|nr:zinc-binding alcohol dehydrogenase family protein [Synechococcaceae cyanobacterium]